MMNRTATRVASNVLSMIALIAVASSWLIIPYVLDGDDLLVTTSEQARAQWLHNYTALTRILTRTSQLPGDIEVTALYATAEYRELVETAPAEKLRPEGHFIFIIEERAQHGDLPSERPDIVLDIDGRVYQPLAIESEEVAGLQRKTIVQFRNTDEHNQPLLQADSGRLELLLTRSQTAAGDPVTLVSGGMWNLPLALPPELQAERATSTLMLVSLAAGLLSSTLMPCLLQLVLFFFATLGGVSVTTITSSGIVTGAERRRIIWSISLFVLGFIVLFAIGGAWIGQAGKQAQIVYAESYRSTGVAAGIAVILFGLWVGVRARVPWVCDLPGAGKLGNLQGRYGLGMLGVAAAFGLGCLSCYGGVIIGALMIYTGTAGSAGDGALVLAMFAAGVAIPFLAAALLFTRMLRLLSAIQNHAKLIGSICMTLIVGFGLLLATDSYHIVSDILYPYLGLN